MTLACLLGSGLMALPARADNHPERAWMVKDSAHFSLHYYPGIERTSARILRAAEDAYPKLAADFGVKPGPRIPIIITQDSFFNGEAEPLKDRITLDPALANSSVIGTRRFVAHELAHVMTFRALNKGSKMAQLGSLGGLPTWFLEGIAQYEAEYWYPSNDRMLRLHSLENSLLTTTERTNFRMLGLHVGASGYNEGYSICRYMFDTHGRGKVGALMASLRDGKRTFVQAIEGTFGTTLPAIEASWRQAVDEDYRKQVQGMPETVPGATRLVGTYQGEVNVQPRLSPDGTRLAYLSSRLQDSFLYLRGNVMGALTLYLADPGGGNAVALPVGRGSVNNFGWSSDGRQLVYSRMVTDKLGNLTFDLFVYDLAGRVATRLTDGEATNHMAWRPRSNQVAYVAVKDGTNVLKLVDTRTKKVISLCEGPGVDQYKDLAWSPDGRRLAMVAYEPGETGHLVLFDTTRNKMVDLTRRRERIADSAPSFTPDGQSLVFSSDRSGMTNLYQIELASRTIRQLTNTYRGAETCQVSPDGRSIFFTTFRAKGSEIHRMPRGTGTPVAFYKVTTPVAGPAADSLNVARGAMAPTDATLPAAAVLAVAPPIAKPPLGAAVPVTANAGALDRAVANAISVPDFRPYQSILSNDLIVPQMTADERGQQVGLAAIYSDILDKQQLGVDVRYGIMSQRFSYMFQYLNRMAASSWSVSLFDQPQIALSPDIGTNGSPVLDSLYFQRQRGAALGLQTPLGGGRTLVAGGSLGTLSTLIDPKVGNHGQLRDGQLNTLNLGYQEQNVRQTVDMDINPTDGYRLGLNWIMSDQHLGSAFNFSQYVFNGERYFSISPEWRHNLTWRWNMGMTNGDAPQPFLLGGANGSNQIFSLRGYSVGAFTGNRLATTGLEYTAPILTHIDKMVGPVYLDRLYVAGFTDVGSAWNQGAPNMPFASYGGEIRLRTSIMGQQLLTFRIGLAKKLGSDDWPGFYLTF